MLIFSIIMIIRLSFTVVVVFVVVWWGCGLDLRKIDVYYRFGK